MSVARRRLSALCALALLLSLATTAEAARRPKTTPDGPLDDGRLDPAYFGGTLQFREADEIDYLWVKDGFTLDGRTLHFAPWPEPELRGEGERDTNDRRLAREMSEDLPEMFQEAFAAALKGRANASTTAGDIQVEGRIVDCSTGNTAAKMLVGFGAGAGNTTFDLKFRDAKTGELLAAVHQRVVSGTSWSTTDGKLANWIDEFAEEVAKKGLQAIYAKGDTVTE